MRADPLTVEGSEVGRGGYREDLGREAALRDWKDVPRGGVPCRRIERDIPVETAFRWKGFIHGMQIKRYQSPSGAGRGSAGGISGYPTHAEEDCNGKLYWIVQVRLLWLITLACCPPT